MQHFTNGATDEREKGNREDRTNYCSGAIVEIETTGHIACWDNMEHCAKRRAYCRQWSSGQLVPAQCAKTKHVLKESEEQPYLHSSKGLEEKMCRTWVPPGCGAKGKEPTTKVVLIA